MKNSTQTIPGRAISYFFLGNSKLYHWIYEIIQKIVKLKQYIAICWIWHKIKEVVTFLVSEHHMMERYNILDFQKKQYHPATSNSSLNKNYPLGKTFLGQFIIKTDFIFYNFVTINSQGFPNEKNFKNFMAPFWMGFNCFKARATLRRLITFYH